MRENINVSQTDSSFYITHSHRQTGIIIIPSRHPILLYASQLSLLMPTKIWLTSHLHKILAFLNFMCRCDTTQGNKSETFKTQHKIPVKLFSNQFINS